MKLSKYFSDLKALGAFKNYSSALFKAKYVPTFVAFRSRGLKLRQLCSEQGTYFHLLSLALSGPLPPPLRRRHLWMAP